MDIQPFVSLHSRASVWFTIQADKWFVLDFGPFVWQLWFVDKTWQTRRNVVRKSLKVRPTTTLLTKSTTLSVKWKLAKHFLKGKIRKHTDDKCVRVLGRIGQQSKGSMSKCQSYKIKILKNEVTCMEIVELAKAFAREQAQWSYIFVGMFSPHWKETSGEILKIFAKGIFQY